MQRCLWQPVLGAAVMGDGRMGGAVEKVNGIQEAGSSPCSVIKARSGPQLILLHSGPRFFFVNRDVLSR